MSCLLANTRREAPASRYEMVKKDVPEKLNDAYIFLKEIMKLLLAIIHPEPITRIDNPNYSIGLLKIISPVGPKRPLTSDIPFISVGSMVVPRLCQKYEHMFKVYLDKIVGVESLNRRQQAHLACTNVLILNPRVGLTDMMSSPLRRFKMVVLPALSRPLEFKF